MNDAAAASHSTSSEISLDAGVSMFVGGDTPEDSFLAIVDVVEEHHGEHSHHPPLSVIEVIGVEPTRAVRKALAEYDFNVTESSVSGFVARRSLIGPS